MEALTVNDLEQLHKKTVEILKAKDFAFSIDEYYDDLDEQFVVKVSHAIDAYKTKHFRATHKTDAWLECYRFVDSIKVVRAFFI